MHDKKKNIFGHIRQSKNGTKKLVAKIKTFILKLSKKEIFVSNFFHILPDKIAIEP
jgi:hypothetical protein